MARGTHRLRQIYLKFTAKVATLMRNNDKPLMIDCGGYVSTFDMILSLWLGPWLLTTGTRFNLKGGLWN
jgi:hypothetical protein